MKILIVILSALLFFSGGVYAIEKPCDDGALVYCWYDAASPKKAGRFFYKKSVVWCQPVNVNNGCTAKVWGDTSCSTSYTKNKELSLMCQYKFPSKCLNGACWASQ